MPFVAAKCPQCGGDLQLDNEMETGFCMHCGSKIIVHEAIRAVRIDNTQMVDTWMKMGDLAAESQNLPEAYEYYTKVVEVQPDNYWAIYKKGKAAGWQSTLVNVRFTESAVCFAKAIELASESDKEKIKNDSTEDIKKLSQALISLRVDRFIKWPDKDEANGFLGDINTIHNAVTQLANKSGVVISGYLEPVALLIRSAVVSAWNGKIQPDYIGDENHPSKFAFDQFIDRIGFCTMLIGTAINLSGEDDEQDIQRYEDLIAFEEAAINSCSWDYEFSSFGKYWHKSYELTDSAKQARRERISQYNAKISQIKDKKQQLEAVEQQEKERKAVDEAQKRFNEYWFAHSVERTGLEAERTGLSNQIMVLEKERNTVTSPMLKDIENMHARIAKLRDEQKTLGIFKGKEKDALQAQIDEVRKRGAAVTKKLNDTQNQTAVKIESFKTRITEIDNELTKAR